MAKPKSLPYEAPEAEGPYSVSLWSQAGGSDKVYNISIEQVGAGWVVNYANGRRGGTLATGTKTKSPVAYAAARKLCNGVLFEKIGGGYVPTAGSAFGEGMQAEAIATIAREASGYIPQLLGVADEDLLEKLINDDDWVAEPKHDGERRILAVQNGVVTGGNRKGQTVAVSKAIADEAATFDRNVVLDGEQIGDRYRFFDILSLDGVDQRDKPWYLRDMAMVQANLNRGDTIQLTPTARTTASKRKLVEDERAAGGEGVVFKKRTAPYEPGKPGAEPSQFKFKFWKSLSAVVDKVNAKRSVALVLLEDDGNRLSVGNVTIPANEQVPGAGDVVEVGYLYAYDGGSLFQPTYRGPRSDIDPAECLASQRVFKQPDDPADDAPSAPRM